VVGTLPIESEGLTCHCTPSPKDHDCVDKVCNATKGISDISCVVIGDASGTEVLLQKCVQRVTGALIKDVAGSHEDRVNFPTQANYLALYAELHARIKNGAVVPNPVSWIH